MLTEDGSNNTNKFNPQEPPLVACHLTSGSNNTNKFNPQERGTAGATHYTVQIIQINSILKNDHAKSYKRVMFK